jgi:tetratricopeptide (TPR) repeat protein
MDVEAESRDLVSSGIVAQNESRFDDAALLFWKALACLEPLAPGRRSELSTELAGLFLKAGHEDLALIARHTQIRLDESLENSGSAINGLIDLGNLHTNLGNTGEARAIFTYVIERCLATSGYASAASASTNLAGLLANEGEPKQALTMLFNSLDYIAKLENGFPDTEFNTHAMIIQVVDLCGADPAVAVRSAVEIGKKFAARVTPRHRQALAPLMQKAAAAFLEKNPQLNPDQWKKQALAWVYD